MQCQLKPTRKNAAEFRAPHNIDVPRDQPTILGRSPVTGITEKKLSRQHVEVTANYSSQTLTVKQLGPNAACYQGEELQKGATVKLSNGDCFELLKGKFEYSVHFSNTETSTPSTSTSSGSLSRPEPKAKGNEEDGFDQEREQVKSSKKRPLDSDSDDGDSEQDEKPEVKKSKTETKPPGDDIDQKLAALQRKAEQAEQKRKDKKLNSTTQIDGGGEKSSSGNADISGRGSTTAPAAGSGKPSTVEEWKEEGKLLVYKSVGVKAGSKIVCFDMDGTLITTSSGKVFAQNADDWKIIYSEVPGKLKKLHDGGYKIVIFTNQLGISKGKLTVKEFRRKLGNVVKKLGVPVQAFAATSGGVYRKPMTGMWEYLLSKGNDGIAIDVKASMYIGDAAGRPADWGPKKKKDFSMSDRLFALNIGIPFKTPEEFFLGFKPAKFNMPAFDPRTVSTSTLFNPSSTALPASVQEVLILVGYPASGKSTFVKNHLLPHKYVHVNRDTIGTWQKCVAACSSALGKGQSVVIDNTNADIESRKRYIDCAKKANVQCRCFSFTTTIDHARHNEKFRQLTPSGKNHASIADMIFYSFRKNFVAPKKEEGYSEVVQVNFLPSFNNSDEEKLYKKFLLEK